MPDLNDSAGDKKKKLWETTAPPKRPGLTKKHDTFLNQLNLTGKQFHFSFWYILIGLLLVAYFKSLMVNTPIETIDFSAFKKKVRSGEIKRVEMGEKFYVGLSYTSGDLDSAVKKSVTAGADLQKRLSYRTVPVADPSFVPLLDSMKIEYYARQPTDNRVLEFILTWIIPFGIMLLIWRFIFNRMGKMGTGVMSFAQNKAQLVAEGDIKTTFADVAGADEAKQELVEVVDFLKNPEKYTAIGGKVPKGVLLVGPPGTGKTLLARAVAGEAQVPFFRISGADFVEMFVGVGAARVRDLFHQGREKAPCIIFIDELDAIGKSRSPMAMGNDEREQTLNQLLVEMDGFDSRTGVILLAATNRPEVLDPALLRPGRFDRQVVVDRPDLPGRLAILTIHSKDVLLDESVDLGTVARATAGFAGADLANIVNEAALLAVRAGRKKVARIDFDEAIEKIIAGLQKRSKLINPHEREIVAYHETGHALTAAFTGSADPVQKISIIPRGIAALGYTMQTPTEDRYLMTSDELLGKIDVLLGGRAAEQLIFGMISTGASNDIDKASDIARRMITDYGMSPKFANVTLRSRPAPVFMGDNGGMSGAREYSETTQQYIDEQVAAIVSERYRRVLDLLAGKKEILATIAKYLLKNETIDRKDFLRMAGINAAHAAAAPEEVLPPADST
ncbi:MAG: ATP-dependent zinc metalloprotease FtsH [Chitinispirillaceae bacterium]|jgi:cell division protease FtsH